MTTESKIRKFKEFHLKNPQVYVWFRHFMLEMLERKMKCSAKMAYERTRWEVSMETKGYEKYKMNNNYHPAYSRIFLKANPQYKDMVETRQSIFDEIYPI